MNRTTGVDIGKSNCISMDGFRDRDQLARQVKVLYDMLGNVLGQDSVDKSIEDMGLEEKVLALYNIVFKGRDNKLADTAHMSRMLGEIEDGISDILARRAVEHRLEQQVVDKMEKRQHQYMDDIRLQIINTKEGPDNANTLRKFMELEKLEHKSLSRSAMDMMRPSSVDEIVGQDRAVKSLITRLATPYPQHVLIYGPPGVGKTTAARLVLEMARQMPYTPFPKDAPFVEVDGTTLRWDPREITNPLLGSVHDPIYQGTKRDLAESGIPEPKTGLVTDAHCGILFIDEIGELDIFLQNKLLKVMEDKRVRFDSSYYDPDDPLVPKYVKKLFDEGAPADFILVGATTRQPSDINPALRSRCAEVFFEPLSPDSIERIVNSSAERIGVKLEPGLDALISQYTTEGRKAVNLLMDAYGMALYRCREKCQADITITKADLMEILQVSRMSPCFEQHARHKGEVGRIFGLGVRGFSGSVIELEAVAFKALHGEKGTIRFNDTAGSMAKDSVSNAASVIRKMTGEDISRYDIHVNAVGGGKIDGPSAGAAMVLLIMSAMKDIPIWQDIAITGEISLQGRIKPVGGVQEKIYGAKQSGMKKVIIPRENLDDVPSYLEGIEVIPAETIEEAAEAAFARD